MMIVIINIRTTITDADGNKIVKMTMMMIK